MSQIDASQNEPRRRSRASTAGRGIGWALIGALAVLMLGVTGSTYQRDLVDRTAETALGLRADAVVAAADAEVSRYLGVVTVLADGLGAFDGITESKFRDLASSLDDMELDGATSVVLIAPPVATVDVAAAQREWRKTYAPDLKLVPNDTRGEHVFALTSVSLDGAPDRAGGVDLSVAAAPYAALMEARRSGSSAISDPYELIIDQELPEQDRQTSFVLVAPVVSDDGFAGWVLMGLRGQSFLGHVLDIATEGRMNAVLSATDATGRKTQVAVERHELTGVTRGTDRTLRVAQQTWVLDVTADLESLVGPSRLMPRNSMIAGVVLSLLVGALIWVLVTGRARSAQKVRDATRDLAAAEVVSRRQASMLDAMVETIDEVGVSVVDADGRLLLQSRAAREILGVDESAHGGAVSWPVTPELRQERFGLFHVDGTRVSPEDMPLVRALRGESTEAVPMLVRNGNRPEGAQIEVSGRPLALGHGKPGALAVFRDVTQERIQQAELAGFAGVVAHDLRHPLTVIGGYIGMLTDHCLPELQGDPELLAETATYLAKASAGAARMDELISDLLAYTTARDAEMTWQQVDLAELVEEVAALHLDGGDGSRPVPHIHVAPLPVIEADPDRLRQLFTNLIGNAVKYVAPGGVPLIDISADVHDGRVRLRFADRGIGITADKRADVFRPFVRVHVGAAAGPAYTGTGLGLAICHHVVQRHGGEIAVAPNPGGGSVFRVDLPVKQRSAAEVSEQEDEPGRPADASHASALPS